jgi:transcription termination/antitermination protein NusG
VVTRTPREAVARPIPMTENTTNTDATPETDEPKSVGPVVDARTNDAVPAPALEGEALQQDIAEKAGYVPEAPEAEAAESTSEPHAEAPDYEPGEAESESAVEESPTEPESDATTEEESKPAKKPRAPRAKKSAAPAESADETVATEEAPADAGAEPTAEAEAPPENAKKWYAIKVQSGREDTIKAAILRKVRIEGLEDAFGQILIPFEEVIEKKSVRVKDKKTGDYTTQEKKVTRKRKKFQGYIFAELEFNDRILYLIRETSGVGDFLKLRPRKNDSPLPEPMTDIEVKQMLGEKAGKETGKVYKIDIEKGDRVKIKEGSFKDHEGEVKEVHMPKDPTDPPKLIVVVTFWGRPLEVELEAWQVAKV